MRWRVWPVAVLALSLGACTLEEKLKSWTVRESPLTTASIYGSGAVSLEKGKVHFANKEYGLAERDFRKAVEEDPNNTEAWLNLAACYDQLRRFDHASRAYDVVVKQVGYTAEVHNNLGYHFYLRNNLGEARKHFLAAYELDPDNPYVVNNLRLVDSYPPKTGVAVGPGGVYK